MQEYSHVRQSSAADLVAALNARAASGWSVVSVTHVPADGFVAILVRGADSVQVPGAEVKESAAEPAGWAAVPEPQPTPATQSQPLPAAQPAPQPAAVATTPVAAAAPAANIPANWYADPSSRFELRYWDGQKWTEHVARGGQQFTDPPTR